MVGEHRPDVSTTGVAAFDFDGTLTEGGSVFGFLSTVIGRRAAYAAAASLSPGLVHAALVGGTVADITKEKLFERTLAGVAVQRLEEVAADLRTRAPRATSPNRGAGTVGLAPPPG
jgi:phosphoserine phosphatase